MRVPRVIAEAAGECKFDLTTDEWYQDPERFWREFKHTGEVRVPTDLEKWLIGQERMKEEFFMQLEEWVRKLKDIQEMRKSGQGDKDAMRRFLKERPGPYLIFVGPPGTGKSLIIKIVNNKLKELYKKHGIELQDVLLIKNPRDAQRPLVRYVPSGMGQRIVEVAKHEAERKGLPMTLAKYMLLFIMVMGVLALATGIFIMSYFAQTYDPALVWFVQSPLFFNWMMMGVTFFAFPLLIFVLGPMMGAGLRGVLGGTRLDDVPAMVVDNGGDPDLYVDMTGGQITQMFGAIQHDPWQSGGLGTPVHHRAVAGAAHRADKKILFFDEFMVALQNERFITEMLQPLEDGMCTIRARAWGGSEGNASHAGETATPVDANFFLVAAMNYNALPLLNNYPALRNRFYYGNIVNADDEMDWTPQNEIRLVQFLTDEATRFNVPHLCAEACKIVIGHARRRASSSKKMRAQMRPYIQDIKKSGQITWFMPDRDVTGCGCGLAVQAMIHAPDVMLAIDHYAKPIEQQILDAQMERTRPYIIRRTTGAQVGVVNGLVYVGHDEGASGDTITVSAIARRLEKDVDADFVVTGMPVEDQDTFMANSVRSVKTALKVLYGMDIGRSHYVHVSIVASNPKGIDGPSAGITMLLAVMSCLGDPALPAANRVPVPMRQDTAITGTVEILEMPGNDLKVGPIGGVFEKAYGAKKAGILRVIVPQENYDNTFFDRFTREVTVKGADSVRRYFDLVRADIPRKRLIKTPDGSYVVE